ncbi:ParB family chromosome partitioning protein [Sphingomonas kyeonggiensis]|uniref:ParB/RepB/Spo0J family partition protein n=1 Tax=Sphingomonas kyeonggiensis TaxID=1268553 RepID=UPI0027850940|nr:ParB N-terminal domain-containing protein [Sphingomonas kyeonggiensis]MDQ0251326.1 ParB family chromosome partitioning protein [Sphingomonas kyeonggiensis]
MELKHIDTAKLCISAVNMRAKGKADLSHILPSIRARGVLVPLIVRPADEDWFEIVAGKRRYHAALAVAEERGEVEPLPCAIMAPGDDAAALEASLIENVARLDPDEVTLWESFTRLVREGRSPEDIALTFGLTELQVKRTLALGNLLPRIRGLYRKGDIDAATVRQLTLASKTRQRDWLRLFDDPDTHCPTGHQLKAWLFGGASVPVGAALFDMADYSGEVVSDLFGEERFFADTASFWAAQTPAIEAKAEGYREAGWPEVVILPTGETFHSWEHERCAKRKGGKVFLAVSARGEVTFHEGYISTKEARRRERGEASQDEKLVRPEVSAPIQNYVDLHRHAAVRADLIGQPSVALRLMVAHAIVGSSLWNVRIEDQRASSDAIAESVENCASEARFDEKRGAVLALLGFDPEGPTVTRGYEGEHGIAGLFVRLLQLPDPALLDVAAIVMGETLEAGSALIEVLGPLLGTDMAKVWQPDDALLDLIRDREVIGCVLADVAGDAVASSNEAATGKVKRGIVRDCLTGENGRAKVEGWVPKWMAFPPVAYTARGGVPTVAQAEKVAGLAIAPEPLPLRSAA